MFLVLLKFVYIMLYGVLEEVEVIKSIIKIIIRVLKLLQEIFFNILLQNFIRIEHFEICILKLIYKLISRKLMDQTELKFCMLSIFKI